jgi:hypothetical protein
LPVLLVSAVYTLIMTHSHLLKLSNLGYLGVLNWST